MDINPGSILGLVYWELHVLQQVTYISQNLSFPVCLIELLRIGKEMTHITYFVQELLTKS